MHRFTMMAPSAEKNRGTVAVTSAEKNRYQQIDIKSALKEQSATGDRISELGESLQAERVQKAAAKLAAFQKFKKDIGIAVCRLELQANDLRSQIRS